jgi:hypothetical protein
MACRNGRGEYLPAARLTPAGLVLREYHLAADDGHRDPRVLYPAGRSGHDVAVHYGQVGWPAGRPGTVSPLRAPIPMTRAAPAVQAVRLIDGSFR